MLTVAVPVDPGCRVFDVVTTMEVFAERRRVGLQKAQVRILADQDDLLLGNRWRLARDDRLDTAPSADVLVVPGRENPLVPPPPAVVEAVAATAAAGRVVASLCTGAFVLAEAGLLDGRTATTHWRWAEELQARYPQVQVNPDRLYAGEDRLWTSAGVSAGTDLLLHIVRQLWGSAAAAQIARSMVTPAFRPGSQAQFMAGPTRPRRQGRLEALQQAVEAQPSRQWTINAMAAVLTVSPRSLFRLFSEQVRQSPGAWLIDQRTRIAQGLLETTDLTMEAIATRAGLGTADSMRRHITQRLGVTPTQHRAIFRQPETPTSIPGFGAEGASLPTGWQAGHSTV